MTNTKQAADSTATQATTVTPAVAAETAVPVTAAATARARRSRKAPAVAETVAKHQKALAEALEQAEAICYDPPQPPKAKPVKAKAAKVEKPAKAEKPVKAKKPKLVRDSYAMPETEYAQIAQLKKRLSALGSEVKKSELLRAGVAVLAALDDAALKAATDRVERIKTGRPAKK